MITFLLKFLPTTMVARGYEKSGLTFAYAVRFLCYGECTDFHQRLRRWARWEAEYLRRGYRAFSVDLFLKALKKDDYEVPLFLERETGEEPVSHAERYRQKYLGKVEPAVDLSKVMTGQAQMGHSIIPTTEKG